MKKVSRIFLHLLNLYPLNVVMMIHLYSQRPWTSRGWSNSCAFHSNIFTQQNFIYIALPLHLHDCLDSCTIARNMKSGGFLPQEVLLFAVRCLLFPGSCLISHLLSLSVAQTSASSSFKLRCRLWPVQSARDAAQCYHQMYISWLVGYSQKHGGQPGLPYLVMYIPGSFSTCLISPTSSLEQ